MVKVRRLPQDDYMHEPEEASNFNESRYYNWFDHGAGMGGSGKERPTKEVPCALARREDAASVVQGRRGACRVSDTGH